MKTTIQIPDAIFSQLIEIDTLSGETSNYLNMMVKRVKWSVDEWNLLVEHVGLDGLSAIRELAKKADDRSLMLTASGYLNILSDVDNKRINTLSQFMLAFRKKISTVFIDGWVYVLNTDEQINPYLVVDMRYSPKHKNNEAFVNIELLSNSFSSHNNKFSMTFYSKDIVGTLNEITSKKGLFFETDEMKTAYLKSGEKFMQHRKNFGAQYLVSQKALSDDNYLSPYVMTGSKCVNDDSLIKRSNNDTTLSYAFNGIKINPKIESYEKFELIDDDDSKKEMFNTKDAFYLEVPLHHYLYMFDLNTHRHMHTHINNIVGYQYKPELREKIVLPELHRDLIDILTSDLSKFEDFIEGKTGGTIILCKGAPGLGKTLTAEIYSEVIQRPLYRVHSGQLGDNADTIEKRLKTCLDISVRLNMVLLIDEADVFIRKRGDDIKHNAVVAAFLRTLEYYSGLLFMTTNRSDAVDDAIASRCIATINYEFPKEKEVKKLWLLMSEQFGIELNAKCIDELVLMFKDITGRDIKELLKLSVKFAKGKNVPLDSEIIRKVAIFRGVEFNTEKG